MSVAPVPPPTIAETRRMAHNPDFLGAAKVGGTQKARGILALASADLSLRTPWLAGPEVAAILPRTLPEASQVLEGQLFARPCPQVPRHGFVDSRRVASMADVLQVYQETRQADPGGEVLLMPTCSARASAVATEASVVWGQGHDGVTAGTGKQSIIPCPAGKFSREMARITATLPGDITPNSAYVEAVEDDGKVRLVQLRDGPAISGAVPNYYPAATYKVTRVEQPTAELLADLLGWETYVLALPAGTVVYLAEGGLSSHAAVHAIAKGLCVLTKAGGWSPAKLPKPGDTIKRPADAVKPLKPAHYRRMAKFMRDNLPIQRGSIETPETAASGAAALSVAVLHSQALWGPETHLLALRAHGATALARLFVAALLGEMRHYFTYVHGVEMQTKLGDVIGLPEKTYKQLREYFSVHSVSRGKIFSHALALKWGSLEEHATTCRADFQQNWGGGSAEYDRDGNRVSSEKGCSYGGRNWARCAKLTLALIQACNAFKAEPTAANWGAVIVAYNAAVEAAHNGGLVLHKFLDQGSIDAVVKAPQLAFLSPRAMRIVDPIVAKRKALNAVAQPKSIAWMFSFDEAIRGAMTQDKAREWFKTDPLTVPEIIVPEHFYLSGIFDGLANQISAAVDRAYISPHDYAWPINFKPKAQAALNALVAMHNARQYLKTFDHEQARGVYPAECVRALRLVGYPPSTFSSLFLKLVAKKRGLAATNKKDWMAPFVTMLLELDPTVEPGPFVCADAVELFADEPVPAPVQSSAANSMPGVIDSGLIVNTELA